MDVARYRGKTLEQIRKIIMEREADEVKVGRKLFGAQYDYRDPKITI